MTKKGRMLVILGGLTLACDLLGAVLLDEPLLLFVALPAALFIVCLVVANRERPVSNGENEGQEHSQMPAAKSREESILAIKERYDLTDREAEMMTLIASGLSRNAIGEKLYLSRNTVDSHIRSLYTKLGCHKKDELVRLLEEEMSGSVTSNT